MPSVLIAPLGDHPAVITAAHDALVRRGIEVSRINILCPNDPCIELGAQWIEEEVPCPVEWLPLLPFADADSDQAAFDYVSYLSAILERCEAVGDIAHILLSGGRKNTSALTAVVAQFYPNVSALYQLLDAHEDNPLLRNLFTGEELLGMSAEERQSWLHPGEDQVAFFEVPFPRFSDGAAIRRYLTDPRGLPPALPVEPAVEEFYAAAFRQPRVEGSFEVFLSQTALDQYRTLCETNSNSASEFKKCFEQMRHPGHLQSENGMHHVCSGRGRTFHFYKRPRTPERPFYYTLPNPIHLYPKRPVDRVVVCGLSVEIERHYNISDAQHLETAQLEPVASLRDLPHPSRHQPAVLLASLGGHPMVASQAYTLLRAREGLDIRSVALMYPADHPGIAAEATRMRGYFLAEGVDCRLKPIGNLVDTNTTEACRQYLESAAQVLVEVEEQFPDHALQFLVSGGRKSMAALNLFAAQHVGLHVVWHTLVRDPRLERRLTDELEREHRVAPRREILFLRQHPIDEFTLVRIPVFPIGAGRSKQ